MKSVFINDLSNILKEFSPDLPENELNDELLIEIMQIAEEYYIYTLPQKKIEQVLKMIR